MSSDQQNDGVTAGGGGSPRTVFSVAQLNQRVKGLLESKLPSVWVEGEISNLSVPSSGHWYFTLKDSSAQIRSAMFRGRNRLVRFTPKNGNQVLVRGKLSLYAPRGDYQLIVDSVEEAGEGALRRAFEELKSRLAAEGLFDDDRKRELPVLPSQVGLITSRSGAVLRDMVHVLQRRFPAISIMLLPVPVQGLEAAPAISKAVGRANELANCDVLIVGRGGGSLEDLWAFNEEQVARAIANSKIPVVSAVGHQTDYTIADFVADVRAPTPSAAAEIVSPDQNEWLQTLRSYEQYFVSFTRSFIVQAQREVLNLKRRLRSPSQELQEISQRLDQLEIRLGRAMQYKLTMRSERHKAAAMRLLQCSPQQRISAQQQQLNTYAVRLQQSVVRFQHNKAVQFAALAQRLESISPLQTLARGYGVARTESGQLIDSCEKVTAGDIFSVQVTDGRFSGKVIESSVKGFE